MKRITFLPIILLSSFVTVRAQTLTKPYEFPIKPGTIQWNSLKSNDEKVRACLIPDTTLHNLTTEALARTCLKYPLFIEIYDAENIYDGFNALTSNFNGFTELLQRKDAGHKLLKMYSEISIAKFKGQTQLQKGYFSINLTYCELLLSQTQILDNLNNSERILVLKEVVKKFEEKQKQADLFGSFGLNTPAVIMGKIITAVDPPNNGLNSIDKNELSLFLSKGLFKDEKILSAIHIAAKSVR